jgi:hypothetical protein
MPSNPYEALEEENEENDTCKDDVKSSHSQCSIDLSHVPLPPPRHWINCRWPSRDTIAWLSFFGLWTCSILVFVWLYHAAGWVNDDAAPGCDCKVSNLDKKFTVDYRYKTYFQYMDAYQEHENRTLDGLYACGGDSYYTKLHGIQLLVVSKDDAFDKSAALRYLFVSVDTAKVHETLDEMACNDNLHFDIPANSSRGTTTLFPPIVLPPNCEQAWNAAYLFPDMADLATSPVFQFTYDTSNRIVQECTQLSVTPTSHFRLIGDGLFICQIIWVIFTLILAIATFMALCYLFAQCCCG